MFDVSLPLAILIAFVICQITNVVTTLYLHRCLAHRALVLNAGLETVARGWLWLTTGIDRREWVAVHRKHHVFADEPQDPHSPVQRGVWRVLLLNANYYRAEASNPTTVATYSRDIRADWFDRDFGRHGLIGVLIGISFLTLLFGLAMAAFISVLYLVMYVGLSACVNSFGHHFGRRPHDNSATNLRWLAALSMGEGMHNDHHEYPRSPHFGSTWWDVGGRLADLMSRLGVARLHRSTRQLRQRQLNEIQEQQPEPEPVG